MAISDTDIANMALALVGEDPLTDLTDSGKAAIIIDNVFEITRKELLELPENWNFCTTRAQLSPLSTTPDFGYDYQYGLPANALRIIAVVDKNGDDIQYRWRREVYLSGPNETDVILTNETECRVKYIVLRTKANTYPGWFVKLFYHNIAVHISKPLTQEDQKYNQLVQMALRAYSDARAANGMEGGEVNEFRENLDQGHNMLEEVRGAVPRRTLIETT